MSCTVASKGRVKGEGTTCATRCGCRREAASISRASLAFMACGGQKRAGHSLAEPGARSYAWQWAMAVLADAPPRLFRVNDKREPQRVHCLSAGRAHVATWGMCAPCGPRTARACRPPAPHRSAWRACRACRQQPGGVTVQIAAAAAGAPRAVGCPTTNRRRAYAQKPQPACAQRAAAPSRAGGPHQRAAPGADDDGVHLWVLHHLPPVVGRMLDAKLLRRGARRRQRAVANRHQLDAGDVLRSRKAQGVDASHT